MRWSYYYRTHTIQIVRTYMTFTDIVIPPRWESKTNKAISMDYSESISLQDFKLIATNIMLYNVNYISIPLNVLM